MQVSVKLEHVKVKGVKLVGVKTEGVKQEDVMPESDISCYIKLEGLMLGRVKLECEKKGE